MARWKAAGPAPRDVDELLWKRFRGAQDRFFMAKQAALSEQDTELRTQRASQGKAAGRGRGLLPIRDPGAARAAYRDILERWSAIGKVPRDAVRPLESRLRAVENAIKAAEDERWRRTNPEARARAEDTAAKLEAQIAALGGARGASRSARRSSCRTGGGRFGRHLSRVARPGAARRQRSRRLSAIREADAIENRIARRRAEEERADALYRLRATTK